MTVDPLQALWISITVASVSTSVGLVPAVGVAWLLARGRFRGKAALSALVSVPLVLPPVVTGLLLLWLFAPDGPVGVVLASVGIRVVFHWWGAVIAAAVMGFPLHVLTARAAFEAVDPRLEAVSHTLGVGPWRTFVGVTLPLALPGVAAATVLAFARALGEFGATAVLAGNVEGRTRTLSLAVHTLLGAPEGDARARPLVLASLALSVGALAAYELLVRRQRRRLELDG